MPLLLILHSAENQTFAGNVITIFPWLKKVKEASKRKRVGHLWVDRQ